MPARAHHEHPSLLGAQDQRLVPATGDTKDTLAERPLYNRKNKHFTAVSVAELLDEVKDVAKQEKLRGEVKQVRHLCFEFQESSA